MDNLLLVSRSPNGLGGEWQLCVLVGCVLILTVAFIAWALAGHVGCGSNMVLGRASFLPKNSWSGGKTFWETYP